MARGDLARLSDLKVWLDAQSDDDVLARLNTQASRFIMNTINRPAILPRDYTETFSGNGGSSILLRNWPVLSITSLLIGSTLIAAAPALAVGSGAQSGYVLDPPDEEPPGSMQSVFLRGYIFTRGMVNCQIAYRGGYRVSAEAAIIPASGAFTITPSEPYGQWGSDEGVTLANGTALTAVASTATPALNQYSVTEQGLYTFNVGNASAAILISYGYVPADLAQACTELVGERYRYRQRIGKTSQSLGGQETTSFSLANMPPYVRDALQNHKRVVPC
jgi:hypothetical protein